MKRFEEHRGAKVAIWVHRPKHAAKRASKRKACRTHDASQRESKEHVLTTKVEIDYVDDVRNILKDVLESREDEEEAGAVLRQLGVHLDPLQEGCKEDLQGSYL